MDATFLGAADPAEVSRHLAASRVLAAPSKTAPDGDTEGLPTTILEAAALGLPVVATRHSGIPEAVVHGETGLLSAEGDPAALAANLRPVLGDDDLRRRLGAQARDRVATSFDLRQQSLRLEDLYDEIRAAARGEPRATPRRRAGHDEIRAMTRRAVNGTTEIISRPEASTTGVITYSRAPRRRTRARSPESRGARTAAAPAAPVALCGARSPGPGRTAGLGRDDPPPAGAAGAGEQSRGPEPDPQRGAGRRRARRSDLGGDLLGADPDPVRRGGAGRGAAVTVSTRPPRVPARCHGVELGRPSPAPWSRRNRSPAGSARAARIGRVPAAAL